MAFKPTEKQLDAMALSRLKTFILLKGGSRSGKTFIIMCMIIMRALAIKGSRHGIFRSTATSCRNTLFNLTFKEALKTVSPELYDEMMKPTSPHIRVNSTEMVVEINGSIIMFGGLDDDNRLERILGQEFLSIYMNEVSEISTFKPVSTLITRLSQRCMVTDGRIEREADPKFYFDCNPSTKKHWAYLAFEQGLNPESRLPWSNPDKWGSLTMNPLDNSENLSETYLENLDNLSEREKKRFVRGEWQTETDGALFLPEWISGNRVDVGFEWESLSRIIVAVDPAVSSHAGSDETGVIVAGIDDDGHCYVLADRTLKATPEGWSQAVKRAFDDYQADCVVAEANQGGDLVKTTLRLTDATLPVTLVHATRGKVVRAEPVSTLYEQGKVSHVGEFPDLEEQLESFTLSFNRTKKGSPDRLDALVWALTHLAVKNTKPNTMSVGVIPGY